MENAAVVVMMRRLASLLLLLLMTAKTSVVSGEIGEDGLCSVYTFVPFTNNGTGSKSLSGLEGRSNPAFTHMAAALLAMQHFNDRSPAVVPELSLLEKNCSIRFDTDNIQVFDTGTVGHLASQSLRQAEQAANDGSPLLCAIAGPFNDQPSLELSVLALSEKIPMVNHRAYNTRVDSQYFSPYTSQTFPGLREWSHVLWHFLVAKGRVNYISLLYALTDTGIQRHESWSYLLEKQGVVSYAQPYKTVQVTDETDAAHSEARGIVTALQMLKNRGFRTIVVALEHPYLELPEIANAAEQLGMNNGDYFWVWFGAFEPAQLFSNNESNITKLAFGSAWIIPIEQYFVQKQISPNNNNDPFYKSWKSQGQDFVDLCNAANPIGGEGEPGYVNASADYFQTFQPEWGAGFLYDSVISIGLGACLAEQQQTSDSNNNNTIPGLAHVEGIRGVDFQGASGRVHFNGPTNGARVEFTTAWMAFNFRPTGHEDNSSSSSSSASSSSTIPYVLTDLHNVDEKLWSSVEPFVYADGRTVPPDLLRDTPNQNYLNPGLRALGLALMSVAIFSGIVAIVWVYLHRQHRILLAAQPYFLYVLGFGSIVSASAILPMSFDESYGWSEEQLSASCMARTWLFCFGHLLIYGSLFSKLWRVNKVLQFARRKIDVRHVLWPMTILFFLALVILSLWNGLDSLQWVRMEIDSFTGESIGHCASDNMAAYIAPLVVIMLIPALLTLAMAWKTKDIDDAYSESSWIFSMIIVQLEICVVAVPLVIILRDVSTNGKYIGFVLMMWTFPMSTLILIFLPKVVAYRKAIGGISETTPRRGEGHGTTRVSGISTTPGSGVYSNPVSRASNAASTTLESITEHDQSTPVTTTQIANAKKGADISS